MRQSCCPILCSTISAIALGKFVLHPEVVVVPLESQQEISTHIFIQPCIFYLPPPVGCQMACGSFQPYNTSHVADVQPRRERGQGNVGKSGSDLVHAGPTEILPLPCLSLPTHNIPCCLWSCCKWIAPIQSLLPTDAASPLRAALEVFSR